jgi:mono/diheme cytochrome c family protein
VARVLTLLFGVVLFAVINVAVTQNYMKLRRNSDEPLPTLNLVAGASEQVLRGAELYDWHCAVCHGPTGLGFEEARSAFPESHQNCESCHRKNNPRTRAGMQGNDNERDTFSIGVAPTLRGESSLRFATATVLHAPGDLTDTELLDVVAFLLEVNSLLPENTVLSELQDLDEIFIQ